jgi:hypothetical protein
MDYRIIKQVLGIEEKTAQEKLIMIEKIADRYAKIDEYARELAENKGRQITIEDRHLAAKRLAAEIGVRIDKREDEIRDILEDSVYYILKDQNPSGGWGRTQLERVPARVHNNIPRSHSGPMTSPWMTVMAINTLQLLYTHFRKMPEILKAIERGIKQLIESQNFDGSWNDVDPSICDSPKNVIQTGMAICSLVLGAFDVKIDCRENIYKGLEYLAQTQSSSTGGWSSLPEEPNNKADSKATSMAIISSLLSSKFSGISIPLEDNMAQRGVQWLIRNQKNEGDWGYVRTKDSFLFGAYYAIEALEIYMALSPKKSFKGSEFEKKIRRAFRRAMNWYIISNRLVQLKERYCWAWVNGDTAGEIANTAGAVIVLLDCAEKDFQFVIRKGIDYLLEQKDPATFWGGDTTIVLMALIRYLYPESRLHSILKAFLRRTRR